MEKMTIHRALAELKLIGARIESGTNQLIPCGFQVGDRLVNNKTEKTEFEREAKASFQSVSDLIDRRNKIKSAIVLKNSTTNVEIAGVTMTIADAINQKMVIQSKKSLIEKIVNEKRRIDATIEKHNAEVDKNALVLAQQTLQKQNVKIGDEDVQKATEPYIKANRAVLIDPIQVEKVAKELIDKVMAFETEVDAVLSEINAVTLIEF